MKVFNACSRPAMLVALLIGLALSLGGCGESRADSPVSGSLAAPPEARLKFGRILSSGPADGYRVTANDSRGTALFVSDATGSDGVFKMPAELAGAQRLVASRADGAGASTTLSTQSAAMPQRQTLITPATTLVDSHRTAHPEATLEQAEAQVKAALRLPDGFRIGFSEQARHHGLSLERLHRVTAVQQQGLLQEGDYTGVADSNTSGFLLSLANSLSQAGIAAAFADPEGAVQSLTGWALGVLGTSISGPAPVLQALQQIQSSLQQIQTEISQLEMEFAQGLEQLEAVIQSEALQQSYTNLASQLVPDLESVANNQLRYSNLDSNSSVEVASFAQELTTAPDVSDPTDIGAIYANQPDGTADSLQSLLKQMMQVRPSHPYLAYNPVSFSPLYQQYSLYSRYQATAIQLLANGVNALSTPQLGLPLAYLNRVCDQLANANSRLPYPLESDQVAYDRKTGVLLFLQVFSPLTLAQVTDFAAGFNPGYTGWQPVNINVISDGPLSHYGYLPSSTTYEGVVSDLSLTGPDQFFAPQSTSLGYLWQVSGGGFTGFGSWVNLQGEPLVQPFMLYCHASQNADSATFKATSQGPSNLSLTLEGADQLQVTGTFTSPAYTEGEYWNPGDAPTPNQWPAASRQLDISAEVFFSSSAPATVAVSNVPGEAGTLTFLQPGQATINASRVDADGNLVSGSLLVSSVPGIPQQTGLQITPRNLILAPGGPETELFATSFYNNKTAADVSQTVQWTTSSPSATIEMVAGRPMLFISAPIQGGSFTVTASGGSPVASDTATFYVTAH